MGCATLQVLKLSHHMHIHVSKYLHTHIIPAHSNHPNTHITQHVHHVCDTEEWRGETGRMGRRERKDGEESEEGWGGESEEGWGGE